MMAMRALNRMTGNTKRVVLQAFHNHLCELTGGGPIWGLMLSRTRAIVWASDAISGPLLSGGVKSPTIFEEGATTILAGGGVAVAGGDRHRRGTVWQASHTALPP